MNATGDREHQTARIAADLPPIGEAPAAEPRIRGIGRPVAIEFVDHAPNTANEVAKVFHCLINGEHVAVSGQHPVTIHGVEDRDEAVAVTLTLLCRDIRIGAPRL